MLPLYPMKFETNAKISHASDIDFDRIHPVDVQCFSRPLTKKEYDSIKSIKSFSIKILEVDNILIGYSQYEVKAKGVILHRLGICPDYRRKGYGKLLIQDIYQKLTPEINKIVLRVSEWDTDTHLWLRACGFKAVSIKKNLYDNGMDWYSFRLELQESLVTG